jgi:hypothetical protein
MSIHKLSAGSGYDYLTRQVAALDATDKGHVGLASYYTERGETPEPGSDPGWPESTDSTLGMRRRRSRCGRSLAPACIPSRHSGWNS